MICKVCKDCPDLVSYGWCDVCNNEAQKKGLHRTYHPAEKGEEGYFLNAEGNKVDVEGRPLL